MNDETTIGGSQRECDSKMKCFVCSFVVLNDIQEETYGNQKLFLLQIPFDRHVSGTNIKVNRKMVPGIGVRHSVFGSARYNQQGMIQNDSEPT